MEKIIKIDALPSLKKRKKVCAYARVSSGKDAMLHSLSNQVSHYSKLIQSNKEYEYAGVYADEAISGTKDNRAEFKRMIEDAKKGKIDLIITKSISRFARNTLTLLETVRELKAPLVCLSALMTTTVPAMEETVRLIKAEAPWCKTVVGGAVLTRQLAENIGADKYAKDAMETVRYAQEIFKL